MFSISKSDIAVVAVSSNNIEDQPVKDRVDEVGQVVDTAELSSCVSYYIGMTSRPWTRKMTTWTVASLKKSRDIRMYICWNCDKLDRIG